MGKMSKEDIRALGKASGLAIAEPELSEVRHNLNAILAAMDRVEIPHLNSQEPMPIIVPRDRPDE